ncbi:inhibitor of vertebrate lysozyme family protein [Metapseudomonas otitidis]|uniref:inhibitor of vertebrate lysozyme family protein n=1 Tax=Metapseudomonas otitidis TaxID=319939 RepID=UPI0013F602A2|nr:inhibitor of vertebrate lysozyme family protein [Pseudomonas otitidis]
MRTLRPLCAALLLGLAGSTALAADTDAEYRLNELLGTDPQYRETWQDLVEDESRLPEWVMNLSGTATPMQAVNEDGDKYLVGQLCDSADCAHQKLLVAFSWDKEDAYALLVQVPPGLPADKSPSRHASLRWLGEPDEAQKAILDAELRRDPNGY